MFFDWRHKERELPDTDRCLWSLSRGLIWVGTWQAHRYSSSQINLENAFTSTEDLSMMKHLVSVTISKWPLFSHPFFFWEVWEPVAATRHWVWFAIKQKLHMHVAFIRTTCTMCSLRHPKVKLSHSSINWVLKHVGRASYVINEAQMLVL